MKAEQDRELNALLDATTDGSMIACVMYLAYNGALYSLGFKCDTNARMPAGGLVAETSARELGRAMVARIAELREMRGEGETQFRVLTIDKRTHQIDVNNETETSLDIVITKKNK